jgi:hypothetical protein
MIGRTHIGPAATNLNVETLVNEYWVFGEFLQPSSSKHEFFRITLQAQRVCPDLASSVEETEH